MYACERSSLGKFITSGEVGRSIVLANTFALLSSPPHPTPPTANFLSALPSRQVAQVSATTTTISQRASARNYFCPADAGDIQKRAAAAAAAVRFTFVIKGFLF